MGRKFTVPYALNRCHGFFNPHLAAQTSFSEDDLLLFWKALENMFDTDRSAARGQMSARKLVVFKHKDALGNAPAHRLLERVKVGCSTGEKPPRRYEDYSALISIDRQNLPDGIEIIEALFLVISRRGRLPRSGDTPVSHRSFRASQTPLPGDHRRFQCPRRHPHRGHGPRCEERLEACGLPPCSRMAAARAVAQTQSLATSISASILTLVALGYFEAAVALPNNFRIIS